MISTQPVSLCDEAETTGKKIKGATDEIVGAMDERKAILRDALNALDMRLQELPERERRAALSLLYGTMTTTVFDIHLALETQASRIKMAKAKTHGERAEGLHAFRLEVEDLMLLYAIK